MAETTQVACTLPGGTELRLCREGHDDGSGARRLRQYGPAVALNGPQRGAPDGAVGLTDVDAAFWAKWSEQNALSPLVTSGCVRAASEE